MRKKMKLYNGFSLLQVRLGRDMGALAGLSPVCGGIVGGGAVCLCFPVVLHVGGMLFVYVFCVKAVS